MSFVSGLQPPDELAEPALWFAFRDRLLLTLGRTTVPEVRDPAGLGLKLAGSHYLGRLDGRHCFAGQLADDFIPGPGQELAGLRELYATLPEPLFWTAGRAVQIVDWERTNRYCGRCGQPMGERAGERAKECPHCGLISYPRLSPAVIVAVMRGNEILLARGARHPAGFYSVLAGFVEPGETLEECVRREVREEVGLEVKEIRYFGSQPWPFPNSLMVGFTAVYASGEIQPEAGEIEDAGWFTADRLPRIPGPISISRRLIDWFAAQHGSPDRPASES